VSLRDWLGKISVGCYDGYGFDDENRCPRLLDRVVTSRKWVDL